MLSPLLGPPCRVSEGLVMNRHAMPRRRRDFIQRFCPMRLLIASILSEVTLFVFVLMRWVWAMFALLVSLWVVMVVRLSLLLVRLFI